MRSVHFYVLSLIRTLLPILLSLVLCSVIRQTFATSHCYYFYRGQPKAGTGLKMQFVSFVFSKSRFQGPAFRCDKIVVIVTLLEAIEGIPDKDYKFLGNENFHNLYERLLHEENLRVDIRGTYL